MNSLKVAIIGGGAAAAGVLKGLALSRSSCEITLFHPNRPLDTPLSSAIADDTQRPSDYFVALYRYLWQEHGAKFPPPKTYFGVSPQERRTNGGDRLWDTPTLGGLTNFWGASAVPFTERELHGWPISSAELTDYYQNVAEDIGIAGATDDLTRYFGREFVTRPSVPPIPLARHLADQISRSAGGYTFFAGNNRLAIETRLDKDNRCIRCGACMTGCGAGSIYSARTDITRHIAEGRLHKIVSGTVQSIDLSRRAIRLNEEPDSHSFDRIYIAAGCIGSTEVILRSVGFKVSPVMFDNVTFTFPIFYFGDAITDTEPKRYFGLSNTAVICAPQTGSAPASFIQIYPLFDHLWRYFIPVAFWPAFAPVAARLRGRVLIARLYLHSSFGTTYVFRMLDHSSIELTRVGEAGTLDRASGLWPAIRAAVAGNGFFIPPLRPIRQTTNSHYSGSLPLGGELVTRDGCLADGIYLCDAANFVDGPALSPTFTIMANAARIAHRSI